MGRPLANAQTPLVSQPPINRPTTPRVFENSARPLPNRLVKMVLLIATVLVVAALGFDFLAPLLLNL